MICIDRNCIIWFLIFGITDGMVGLVNLNKFFCGIFVCISGSIRMILDCHFTVRALDFS
ncbi:MAG: hypothetical protein Q7U88_16005 [Desulfocapsaceae bacterium]|nr:hypothetical protein [Desulfocapsaceae bacterium]